MLPCDPTNTFPLSLPSLVLVFVNLEGAIARVSSSTRKLFAGSGFGIHPIPSPASKELAVVAVAVEVVARLPLVEPVEPCCEQR